MNFQFFVYLLAYIARVVDIILFEILGILSYMKPETKEIAADIQIMVMVFVVDVFPTFIIMFLHYRAFNPSIEWFQNNMVEEASSNLI